MRKAGFLLLIILAIATLQVQNKSDVVEAQGGGWVNDRGGHYWKVGRVCLNGATIDIASASADTIGAAQFQVDEKVEFVQGLIPMKPSEMGDDGSALRLYGSRMGPEATLVFRPDSVQAEPIEIPTGDSYLHISDLPIYWSRQLNVGEMVAVQTTDEEAISSNSMPVENCLLPILEVDEEVTIDDQIVTNPYSFLDSDDLYFEVDSKPASGTLSLNGEPLEDGDLFTGSDVADGRLIYQAGGSATDEDQFEYSGRATIRLSVANNGDQAEGVVPNPPFVAGDRSWEPSISADGSKTVFSSTSTNLSLVGDDNGLSDVFVRHLKPDTPETIIISKGSTGSSTANNTSFQPDISADGRSVAFSSSASNFNVDTDENRPFQIFRSGSSDPDGGYFSPEIMSFFRYKNEAEAIVNDTEFALNSFAPSITSQGVVAFHTFETLPDEIATDSNSNADVVVNYPWSEFPTNPISLASDLESTTNNGSFLPEFSDDGAWVVFETDATDFDPRPGFGEGGVTLIALRTTNDSFSSGAVVSVNNAGEVAESGNSNRPQISRSGKHIVFDSAATNLAHNIAEIGSTRHIYVHDRFVRSTGPTNHCTIMLTQIADSNGDAILGNGDSTRASISANGRFVAFQSVATNLVPNDTNFSSDIFVVDRDVDGDYSFYSDADTCTPGPSRILRVSISGDGTPGNGHSTEPAISGNGDFVAFNSAATNLVAGDTNGIEDVFLHYIGYQGIVRFAPTAEEPTPTVEPTVTVEPTTTAEPTAVPTATPEPPVGGLPFKSFLPVTVR